MYVLLKFLENRRYLYLILLFALAIASCKKDSAPDKKDSTSSISGRYIGNSTKIQARSGYVFDTVMANYVPYHTVDTTVTLDTFFVNLVGTVNISFSGTMLQKLIGSGIFTAKYEGLYKDYDYTEGTHSHCIFKIDEPATLKISYFAYGGIGPDNYSQTDLTCVARQ